MHVDPKEELRISQSVHFPKILCVKALSLFVMRNLAQSFQEKTTELLISQWLGAHKLYFDVERARYHEYVLKCDLFCQYSQISAMEKKTKKEVDDLREIMKRMSVDMRLFSLTMRSLYAEKEVGTDEEVAKEFRKLRDDTRNDAMVYIEGILPLTTEFVTSISAYFDYYDALSFDDWCQNISLIRQETADSKKLCMTILKLHHAILVPLKKRRDQAGMLVSKIKGLDVEFEKKKEEQLKMAGSKRFWALALCFVPYVGTIARTILDAGANQNLVEAIALKVQAFIHGSAALAVKETLIPVLEAFIGGISKAATFFSIMEQELKKFENNAGKSEDDPQVAFYKVMKVEASDMKSICQLFHAAVPDVKTDFQALPTEGTDRNYVDEWLEKQKKMIEEECEGTLARRIFRAIANAW